MGYRGFSADYLRECFEYRPHMGGLYWKPRPKRHFASEVSWRRFNEKYSRKRVGTVDSKTGYRKLTLDGVSIRAHNLVWIICTGTWPKEYLDHINHKRDDNRIVNLREVSKQGNGRNHSLYKNNKSGVSGVYWQNGRWKARLRPNRKAVFVGSFEHLHEAEAAIIEARNKLGFHPNHGA